MKNLIEDLKNFKLVLKSNAELVDWIDEDPKKEFSELQTILQTVIDRAENESVSPDSREELKEAGYFTDNLWSVDDVQGKYKCTDQEAYLILGHALQNDGTMDQIWYSIDHYAEDAGFKKMIDS